MITLPVVASNMVGGVERVDRRLLEMGDVYRLSGGEKFRAIVIPSTLPYLVAGMKVGFRLALQVSGGAGGFCAASGVGPNKQKKPRNRRAAGGGRREKTA